MWAWVGPSAGLSPKLIGVQLPAGPPLVGKYPSKVNFEGYLVPPAGLSGQLYQLI